MNHVVGSFTLDEKFAVKYCLVSLESHARPIESKKCTHVSSFCRVDLFVQFPSFYLCFFRKMFDPVCTIFFFRELESIGMFLLAALVVTFVLS